MATLMTADRADSMSSTLALVLLDSSVKVAALLIVALVTAWALKRASAATRDRVWTLAFCGAVLLPVLSCVVPQWRIAVVGIGPRAIRATADTATQAAQRIVTSSNPRHMETNVDLVNVSESGLVSSDDHDDVVASNPQGPRHFDQSHVAQARQTSPTLANATDVASTLLVLWLVGVVVLAVRFAMAVRVTRKLLSRSQPLTDPVAKQLLDQSSIRLGLARPVRLLQSDNDTVPMTMGVFRPAVLIPGNWHSWPVERLRFVTLHELAHVKRLDLLFQYIARLACALYWYNPLAWYALYRMRIDCELACDDHVVATGESASTYAGELIQIARIYRPARFASGIAMARSSKLDGRIVSLLDSKRPHGPVSAKTGRFLLAFSAGIVFVLATMSVGKSTAVAVEPEVEKPAGANAGANGDTPRSDKPNPNKGPAVATDVGEFELNVEGPEGQPVSEATVELRRDPAPTAEQIRTGKFVRTGDYGTFVTTDSEGRVTVKWPPTSGKTCILRIVIPGHQPYWASWHSENGSAEVPAKFTAKLQTLSSATGLAYRDGGKSFLGRRGGGIFFVAAIDAARREIGIDGAAAIKVQSVSEQYCQEMADGSGGRRQTFRDLDELKGLSPEEQKKKSDEQSEKRKADVKQTHEKFMTQLRSAMTAEQFERLQQITWQAYGSEALQFDQELAQALELNKDDLKKIVAINRESDEKSNGQIRAVERDAKAKESLTEEQREKLAKLEGKPFDLERLASRTPLQRFGWFGGSIIFLTVADTVVQKDLGLNDEAVTRVNEFVRQFREAKFEAGGGFIVKRARLDKDRLVSFIDAELTPRDYGQWNALTAKFLPKLKEVLTEDQYTRLQQIHWQARGTAAYSDPEVIQALAISQEQQSKIASITDEYRAKRQELLGQGDGGGGDPGDRLKKLSDLIHEHDSKIDESLTKAQRNTFATIKGKEFDVDLLRILEPFPRPERGRADSGNVAGGRGPGVGPSGRRIPPNMIMANGVANGGIFSTIRNEAVQKELELSKDTMTKILEVAQQFNKAWNEAGGGLRIRLFNRGMFQEAAMPPWGILRFPGQTEEVRNQEIAKKMELWKDLTTKFQPQLKDALTAEQFTRLQQINWQAMGTAAYYSDPEIIQALVISIEQQDRITLIMDEYRAKREKLFFQQSQGGGDDGIEKVTELIKEQDAKITESLTKDQLEKFATMKGHEFDLNQLRDVDPRAAGGGRGGRPKSQPPQAE